MNENVVVMIPTPVYIKIHAVVVFGGCVIKDLQTRVRSIYYLYFKLSFGLTMNDEILMVDTVFPHIVAAATILF